MARNSQAKKRKPTRAAHNQLTWGAAASIDKAVKLIEGYAQDIKDSHTINGEWIISDSADALAKLDYDEARTTAAELRDLIK